jgi:hypothetical protein
MIKILKNISEIPVAKVNKVTIVFNEKKLKELIKDINEIRYFNPSSVSTGDWRDKINYNREPSIRFIFKDRITIDDSKDLVDKVNDIIKSLGFKTLIKNELDSNGLQYAFHVILIEHGGTIDKSKRVEFKNV